MCSERCGRQAVISSFDKIATLVCPSRVVVDSVVAQAAHAHPPVGVVKARLPATSAVMDVGGWRLVATLATRTGGEILLTQSRVSDLLLLACLGYWIDSLAWLAVKATGGLHRRLTLQRCSLHTV